MKANRATGSLIDDASFVDQLQDLDSALDSDRVEAPAATADMAATADADRLDASIWLAPREVEKVSVPFEPVMFDVKEEAGLSGRLHVLIAPAAFFLLMLVGAGAAALLFHERVALLL
jgi:hypothetical protein